MPRSNRTRVMILRGDKRMAKYARYLSARAAFARSCISLQVSGNPDLLAIVGNLDRFLDTNAPAPGLTPDLVESLLQLEMTRREALIEMLKNAAQNAVSLQKDIEKYFANQANGDPNEENPGVLEAIAERKKTLEQLQEGISAAYQ